MGPGSELSVLIRVAVDRVVQEIAADAAVVEQRVAFARRTVADDVFPWLLISMSMVRIFRLVSSTFLAKVE